VADTTPSSRIIPGSDVAATAGLPWLLAKLFVGFFLAAYEDHLGKGRSPGESRHSVAGAK
jgi:hypothetical protein